jgi:hypothetical protein
VRERVETRALIVSRLGDHDLWAATVRVEGIARV